MEEYQTYETTGVEETTPDAAGQEYTEDFSTEEPTHKEPAETSEETGEEENPAAEGEEEAEQEDTTQDNDRVEQAFAKRLAKEREKIQQEVMKQYEPLLNLAQTEAQKYGMDPIQWAQAVQQNAEQQYYAQLQQQGIDPSIVENHPAVLRAKQYEQQLSQKEQQLTQKEQFAQEAAEFFDQFPDVDAKTIPPEVWKLREEKGLTILDAYLRTNYKKLAEQARVKGEQSAIAAQTRKKKASTGPAKGGANMKKSAWEMSRDDFNRLVEKAKRGEIKSF